MVGERFAVRNSGAIAVVEGVGDHCCEYMTGGIVAILGDTGINFGAGMSGGIAFVFDPDHNFKTRCNLEMITVERLTNQSRILELHGLLNEHYEMTDSLRAKKIIENWEKALNDFVVVVPYEYRKVLVKEKRGK